MYVTVASEANVSRHMGSSRASGRFEHRMRFENCVYVKTPEHETEFISAETKYKFMAA